MSIDSQNARPFHVDLIRFALFACVAVSGLAAQSTVWQALLPASPLTPQPGVRRSPAMAYDSARDVIVMVGGRINQNGSNVLPQETWEFDGGEWVLAGPVGPAAVVGYNDTTNIAAYYDSQRQLTVAIESTQNGPTRFWEWDGASWTLAQSLTQPPFTWRYDFEVCYDPIRGVGVLFGGTNGGVHYSDTWEYDGTTVVQRIVGAPPARWGHAMAWDSDRSVVVMYGGRGSSQYSDMWDWNGNFWQPTPNAAGPGIRTFHDLVYDEARSRLVLMGNYSGSTSETWEWDAMAGWTLMSATQLARSNMKAVYDSSRRRVVMFGGSNFALMTGPTATFGYGVASATASAASQGAGCPGPNGQTVLQAGGTPSMGAFMPVQLTNVPTGPINLAFVWIGFDNQSWNGIPLPASLDPVFPGCFAHMAPEIGVGIGTTVTGTLSWGVSVPFVPALDGSPFFLQGGVLVLGFNPGGVVFTNGLSCTIGL